MIRASSTVEATTPKGVSKTRIVAGVAGALLLLTPLLLGAEGAFASAVVTIGTSGLFSYLA